MPFQLLDVILGGVMLISALLALMRGFTREVLSLIAWGLAAVAALGAYYSEPLHAALKQYIQPDALAIAVGSGAAFLIVLIVVSLISVKLADWILDSSAGPFDRTLGFFYGLARGLLLVVVAYMFYVWLKPAERREDWVKNARSLPVIEATRDVIVSFLPAKFAETLAESAGDAGALKPGTEQEGESGYKNNQQRVLDQLIESTQQNKATQQTPQFGNETNTQQ
jgi:membrane protein required for colicin V production